MALLAELLGVHLGRRRHPQFDRNVALVLQQLAGGAEMTDVGHARADEHLVNLGAGHIGQGFDIVRVVRAGHDRLVDVGQVDLDHGGILGVRIALEQLRVGQPSFHRLDAAVDGAHIGIAAGNHPLQHGDVAGDVLNDRLLVQVHGAAAGTALGGGVAELERLLHFQVGQPFDLQDATREDVFLALFGHGQQAGLDGVQRDRIHQITQGDARLHLALETHQHALGHVQRHHAGGGTKGHQARAGREADADREAGVAVAARAHGVGQQHAIEPAVDDAVARAQADAAPVVDELGQLVVHLHIHRLRVGRGMAEGLHHQVGAETQAGQVLELVPGHGASGVLGAHAGHAGLAIGAGTHALLLTAHRWQAAGPTDHFLCQGEALGRISRIAGQPEQGAHRQPQRLARLGGQTAADDQRYAAAGPHLVEQHLALELKLGNQLAIFERLALVGTQLDHIAHGHLADVEFNRQRTRVFHGVVKNRGNLAAQTDAAKALVRHKRDVLAGEPEHRVGG